MAYPKDYRYNPYDDTSTAVQVTEYHLVPSTSPYEVRLNEVPQKVSPSTMTVKAVTSFSSGAPVLGTTFTEVSATPSSDEYFPDYYTGADEDPNWNTGTLQFNAANAGQLVQVVYYATGALASLKSNHYPTWMTDRGNGSDGVFAPSENTTLDGGEHNYSAVYIPSGVTVTCNKSALIKVQGAFVNKGTLQVTPCGGSGGAGSYVSGDSEYGYTYRDTKPGEGRFAGGGSGGAGGTYYEVTGGAGGYSDGIIPSVPFLLLCGGGGGGGGADYRSGGSYGGRGGDGGGALFIAAGTFQNNGTISANGGNASSNIGYRACGGGGGGGGVVAIAAVRLLASGTITVNKGLAHQGRYPSTDGEDGHYIVVELGE